MKLKTQKGITLIALIITIIVMLILVGVTVTVALNGGLFNTAKQATSETEIELEKERLLELAMGALNNKGQVDFEKKLDPAILADGTFEGSNGTYTSKKTGNKYTVSLYGSITLDETIVGKWEQNGDEIKFVAEDGTVITTLKIGDKVNYIEGTSGSYTTEEDRGTYLPGKTVGTYTIDGANNTTAAGNLEWRVLGLDEEGQIELISTTPTTASLVIYGNEGYLNAVTDEQGNLGTLDTFCNNLYGKGKGALRARSLNVEDVYEILDAGTAPKPQTYLICWLDAMEEYTQGNGYCISLASNNPSVSNLSDWDPLGSVPSLPNGITVSATNPGPFEIDLYNNYANWHNYWDDWGFLTCEGEPVEGWTNGEPSVRCIMSWLADYDCSGSNGGFDFLSFNICRFEGIYPTTAGIRGYRNVSSCVRPVVVLNSSVKFTPVDSDSDGVIDYYDI